MKAENLVSVLMPVYNAANFLEECLASILEQSDTAWELLAVDDGSTDDSKGILEAFAHTDPRIKVFQNKGKGIIPALRLAFSLSKGHFITRMDADDKMHPDKLNLLKTYLTQKGPGHLSTGWVKYFSNTELGDGYRKYQEWLNQTMLLPNPYSQIYKECVIPSPNWMIHRSDLIRCRAFESDQYPEDYDLCFRFYENDLQVGGIKQVLHYWRDHPERTSRTDSRYSNPNYFELKLPYFLQLDFDPNKNLVLWGAGKKGKQLARKLNKSSFDYTWVCDNPEKIGKKIFGQLLQPYQILNKLTKPQIIIAVAGPEDQKGIKNFLKKHNFEPGFDYFFFC